MQKSQESKFKSRTHQTIVNPTETISRALKKSTENFNFSLNSLFIRFLLDEELTLKVACENFSDSGTLTRTGIFRNSGKLIQSLQQHQSDYTSIRATPFYSALPKGLHYNQLYEGVEAELHSEDSFQHLLPFSFPLNPFDTYPLDQQAQANLSIVSQFIAERFDDGWGGPWVLYNEGEFSLVYGLKRDQGKLTENEWSMLYKGFQRRYKGLASWEVTQVMGLELPYLQPKQIWPFHRSSPQGIRVIKAGGSKRVSLFQVRRLLGII